jgi:ABC-type polysaccharide/polyol phosphate export permease
MNYLTELKLLLDSRFLVWNFLRRDLRGRYVGSVLGFFWSFINPLILIAILTFIFSVVLHVRFSAEGGTGEYVLYLFCGMLPWLVFQESLLRSTEVIFQHASLLRKYNFPVKILPLHLILSSMANHGVGILILCLILILRGHRFTIALFSYPAVLLIQFLLSAGLSWFLAALNVYLRDISQLVGALLLVWMYGTPIFYPEEMIPAHYRWMITINPLSHIVHAYRSIFLEGAFPGGLRLLYVGIFSLVVFSGGMAFFHRHQRSFVDLV